MRATAANCGTTSGRPAAARTSAIAARPSGTTTCSSKRPTTTSCRSTRRTGKERWHVEIADFDEQYFSTTAPIVVDNHVLVGTGNDLDMPGFLQSFDPETGKLQWKFYTVPMKPGDPGLETWPSLEAARHGGGQVVAARRLRSGDAALHLRHRQSDAGVHRRGAHRRQPLHLLARRRQRRHRQDGVVLPDLGARHARLGFGADADSDRRHDQRQAAQARVHGVAQRLLLHARSRDRRAHRDEQVRHGDQLGEGHASDRRRRTRSRQGGDDSRLARVAGRRRRDQLAAARVLAGDRSLLRARAQRLQHALPERSRSARLDGAWRQDRGAGRRGAELPDRDRLPDRQGRVAASVSRA